VYEIGGLHMCITEGWVRVKEGSIASHSHVENLKTQVLETKPYPYIQSYKWLD